MKKGKLIVLLSLFAGIVLTSCLGSSETTKQISGDASIEIKSKVVGQDTTYLYAPTFYVESTFSATKATAYLKNDPTVSYNLTMMNANGTIWSYVPANAEYVAAKPTEGDYIFKVKFTDGDSLLTTDLLSSSIIYPVTNVTATWTNGSYKVKWDKDSKHTTSLYAVRVYDSSNRLVFSSPQISSSTYEYTFNANTSGWATAFYPANGSQYTIEVAAYQYDDTSNTSSGIQAIAREWVTVKWGE